MKKGGVRLLVCLIAFWSCFISCTTREDRRVLIVHSYEENYAGYPEFNRLIAKEFHKKGINADIKTVYLDCESYNEKKELQRMWLLLDSLAGWQPEAIIVNDDQATYSLLKCAHPFVRKVPVVFGGVNYPNWKLIKQYPNVTGFHDKIDFNANIEMGKNIFGEKIRFFTLLDSTFLDMKIREDFQRQMKNEKVAGLGNYPRHSFPELRKKGYSTVTDIPVRLNTAEPTGLIWFLSKYLKSNCYIQVKRDFTTVNVSNIAQSPSLTAINEAFGFDERLLGGYFTPLSTQVEEEVDAVVKIMHGEGPENLPVKESAKAYQLDWKILEQLQIPLDNIPSHYTIIGMPFSVRYRALWISILSISGILLLALICRLVFLYRREQKRKKKALYALANEKENLALAIEGSNTYAWKYENGVFTFETAFWQSVGVEEKSLTIDSLIPYIHPKHQELFAENWKKLPEARKEIAQVQCDFNGKGYQWWEFRYTTSCPSDGSCRTAGLLLNIQAFKAREQELEEARNLAEKADLKESFLANMSHEIRTPLNAIVGFSTLLASDEEMEQEEKQEYIQAINSNNELLLKLIHDILELSRLESGHMSFTFEKCEVGKFINGIYSSYSMLVSPELQFIKKAGTEIPLEINVDKNRLMQVLTNFLNNAGKFTKEGSITIGYTYVPEKDEVEIYVEDTGQGIDPAEKEIIFSRFYKHNEFAQGTGLGLAISKSIIEKLNGRIELRSELGKGSRFTVVLPCKAIL